MKLAASKACERVECDAVQEGVCGCVQCGAVVHSMFHVVVYMPGAVRAREVGVVQRC